MKKLYHLIYVLTVLCLGITAQEKSTQNILSEVKVYITKTGTKYHSQNCSYLKGNGIQKNLSEVKGKYSPCSKCYVPDNSDCSKTKESLNTVSKEVNSQKPSVKKEEENSEKTSSGQTIYTGPRGGKYYINKNGKKTYIKH